jgi:hypothetical protein
VAARRAWAAGPAQRDAVAPAVARRVAAARQVRPVVWCRRRQRRDRGAGGAGLSCGPTTCAADRDLLQRELRSMHRARRHLHPDHLPADAGIVVTDAGA